MSMLRKTPVTPVNETEKALVLHSSAYRLNTQQALTAPPQTTTTPQGLELDLFDSLQRHWKLASLVFASIAIAGTMWAVSTMHPTYEAETTIFVPQDFGKSSLDGPIDISYPTLVNQQVMTIMHYDTLSEAVQRMKKLGVAWKNKGETERQSIDRLRGALNVQRVPDSFEIAIQMTDGDPKMAAVVANTVAQAFLDAGNRPDATGRMDRGAALQQEKAALEAGLQKQMDLHARLAESLQIVNLQKGSALPDDEVLNQMRQALAVAHRKRVEAEEELAAGPAGLALEAQQIAANDPNTRSLETNLLTRQFQLREQIKNMTPAHPAYKAAQTELGTIDAELKSGSAQEIPRVTAGLIAKLHATADESRRVENSLQAEIAKETSNIPAMSKNLAQAEFVNNEIQRLQGNLSRVEGQIEEVNNRAASGSVMRIFSIAQPPSAPVKSQKVKALSSVFAIALLLGLGIPVALDLFDSRIYDPATIERLLGFPMVGMTIERTPKTEQFADEHLRRLAAGIERGIAGGAKTVLLTGLKQPVAPSIIRDISRQLAAHNINVSVRAGRRRLEPSGQPMLINAGLAETDEDCDVVLMDAPALVFSAEAERLAAEADMTLVVVQAGTNTRPELVRGARLLERLNVAAVGVILQDVKVERAGRSLRRDLKEYMALQRQLAGLTGSWVGW